ncbi:MAG: pentapeptide repeat-containing protein [Leptolyngbyaceae cyanobacterium SM1_3_5]|nr:pentapeptide repeat-containing protein [Leptolyngbyaceae cyanobacterium SM1_3_5]
MPPLSSLNFAHQDLRNRSFRQQDLSGADFRGADLRGCDFSGARLRSANFDAARLGQTRQQLLLPLGIMLIGAIALFDAVSHLLFGVLGRTAAESGWSFVIALCVSLAIAATAIFLPQPAATLLSGTASGALLSFYYGGRAADNQAQIAIASAIFGGTITLILLGYSLRTRHRRLWTAPVWVGGAIAAYALALFAGTWAIAAATTFNWPLGFIFAVVSLAYFAITLLTIIRLAKRMRSIGATCFYKANLADAKLTNLMLENADFSGAIGLAARQFD